MEAAAIRGYASFWGKKIRQVIKQRKNVSAAPTQGGRRGSGRCDKERADERGGGASERILAGPATNCIRPESKIDE